MTTEGGVRLRPGWPQILCVAAAAGLVIATLWLPFWKMNLVAPQYPGGLYLTAYGTQVIGDLKEINIINHYVGMEHIDTVPAPEMGLFPFTVAGLVALILLSIVHRRLMLLAALVAGVTPLVILADLQWWLHSFGRNLKPTAPLRVEPFTPLSVGVSRIGNFRSTAWVSWGFFAFVVAALLLVYGARRWAIAHERRMRSRSALTASKAAASVMLLLASTAVPPTDVLASGARPYRAVPTQQLQERLDAASPGSTVTVRGGVYAGPLTIRGPLRVIGIGRPVIDGGGVGSVVTIGADAVHFEGFEVRNSGRQVTEEAAGIKVTGSGHTIRDNVVEESYFGIHLEDGSDNLVERNLVRPGKQHGARPGHAISLWRQTNSRVAGNVIRDARDGIYLSFADQLVADGNDIQGCRYALHSMYSEESTFTKNVLRDNLVGGVLMYSDALRLRCNRIERHRRGPTAYGVLLKDIGDLVVEDNVIVANRVGIYADNTPLGPGRSALVRNNLIAGHEVALALQSNVALTFYGNQVVANLIDVQPEGSGLSAANRWSQAGRGNYWEQYNGYDSDGDGIGDIPYRYELVMTELLRAAPLARALIHTPASLALERAARMFPLYRPAPLLVDEHPLMAPTDIACTDDDDSWRAADRVARRGGGDVASRGSEHTAVLGVKGGGFR